jgi:hypothetical protein
MDMSTTLPAIIPAPPPVLLILDPSGTATVFFAPSGTLRESFPDGDLVELTGRIDCAFCQYGPMTVSAPAGEVVAAYCPRCAGPHRLMAVGDPPPAVA